MKSAVGAMFEKLPDGSVLVSGPQGKDTYTITANTDLSGVTGIRLEALADAKLPVHGPGRAPTGNFVLSELRVTEAPTADPSKTTPIVLQNASADFSQVNFAVGGAIDGNPGTGWALSGGTGKDHVAVFEAKEPVGVAGGATLTFTLDQQYADGNHTLGKFRLSLTRSPRPLSLNGPPANVTALLAIKPADRTVAQKTELAGYFRSLDSGWAALQQSVAAGAQLQRDKRLLGAQDLAWALINSPAFLFNR
jgi:hypothetical protein